MNDQQLEQLFKPINASRVVSKSGVNHGAAYLETWDVIAHLIRIFGPLGWNKEVKETALVFESESQGKWTVCYRATVRLVIHPVATTYVQPPSAKVSEDVATGTAVNQPSRGEAHDLALKTAVSDALKRAAKDLGNQFGLSLYNDGSKESVVGSSLAHPQATEEEA